MKKLNCINFLLNIVYYDTVSIVNMFYKYRFVYTVSFMANLAISARYAIILMMRIYYKITRGGVTYGIFQQSLPSR